MLLKNFIAIFMVEILLCRVIINFCMNIRVCHLWLRLELSVGHYWSAYDYTWRYRPHNHMSHADAMSRLPIPNTDTNETVTSPAWCSFYSWHIGKLTNKCWYDSFMELWIPVLSKILNCVCTGWPSVNNDKSMSVYFNRQSELSVEQGCLLWGARIIIQAMNLLIFHLLTD